MLILNSAIFLLRLTLQLTFRRSNDDRTVVTTLQVAYTGITIPPPPPPPGYRHVLEVWILGLQMLGTVNFAATDKFPLCPSYV